MGAHSRSLPRPDFDYISTGPWTVSFWLTIESKVTVNKLDEAVRTWWKPVFGLAGSPLRRTITDANDVIILGAEETTSDAVATCEVLDLLDDMVPGVAVGLRLEVMWDLSQ